MSDRRDPSPVERSSSGVEGTRLSRIGVAVANTVTAVSVTTTSAAIVFLAANTLDAELYGMQGGSLHPKIGRSFDPDIVLVAGHVLAIGMAVLATAGLLGLLARFWRSGPLLPTLSVVTAIAFAAPVFVGAALIFAVHVELVFPFPVLALAVLVAWLTTRCPLARATAAQLPDVRQRMRERVDITTKIAVAIQFGAPLYVGLLTGV